MHLGYKGLTLGNRLDKLCTVRMAAPSQYAKMRGLTPRPSHITNDTEWEAGAPAGGGLAVVAALEGGRRRTRE